MGSLASSPTGVPYGHHARVSLLPPGCAQVLRATPPPPCWPAGTGPEGGASAAALPAASRPALPCPTPPCTASHLITGVQQRQECGRQRLGGAHSDQRLALPVHLDLRLSRAVRRHRLPQLGHAHHGRVCSARAAGGLRHSLHARCGSSKHALGVQARVAGAKRRTKAWPSACSATRQGWPPRRMHAARSAKRAPTLVAVFIHGGCGSLLHALWPFQLLPDSPGGRDQGDKELQKQTDQLPSSK